MVRVAAAEPPSIRVLDSLILFSQAQPFLLLVNLLFVLLLVCVSAFSGESKGDVSTFSGKSSQGCFHFQRGKLPKIRVACG